MDDGALFLSLLCVVNRIKLENFPAHFAAMSANDSFKFSEEYEVS